MNSITPMPRIENQKKTRQKIYTHTYAIMFLVLHVSMSDNRSVL